VQEALTNVAKHAGARRVSVVLVRSGSNVTAVVEDDGHGFVVDDVADSPDGIGLAGMRERVALVEGRLVVESAPGAGTTLVAEVPAA
jgi:signal transduction histidine kinase